MTYNLSVEEADQLDIDRLLLEVLIGEGDREILMCLLKKLYIAMGVSAADALAHVRKEMGTNNLTEDVPSVIVELAKLLQQLEAKRTS